MPDRYYTALASGGNLAHIHYTHKQFYSLPSSLTKIKNNKPNTLGLSKKISIINTLNSRFR
jgi:hypothetical protein